MLRKCFPGGLCLFQTGPRLIGFWKLIESLPRVTCDGRRRESADIYSKLFALRCSLRLLRLRESDKENWMCVWVTVRNTEQRKTLTLFALSDEPLGTGWVEKRTLLFVSITHSACECGLLCFFAVVFLGLLCHNMCQWAPAELLTILRTHAPQLGIISYYFKQIGDRWHKYMNDNSTKCL